MIVGSDPVHTAAGDPAYFSIDIESPINLCSERDWVPRPLPPGLSSYTFFDNLEVLELIFPLNTTK